MIDTSHIAPGTYTESGRKLTADEQRALNMFEHYGNAAVTFMRYGARKWGWMIGESVHESSLAVSKVAAIEDCKERMAVLASIRRDGGL